MEIADGETGILPPPSERRKVHALAKIKRLSREMAAKYVGILLAFILFVFLSNLFLGMWIILRHYP